MRFKVYLLRRRGRRLSWQQARNGPSFVGRLVTHLEDHAGEQYKVTTLQPDDPMQEPKPALYEAQLVGFAPVAFRLRGFERIEGAEGPHSVVQEWHIEAA